MKDYVVLARSPAAQPETSLLDKSHLTGFALNTLDRLGNRREDVEYTDRLRAAPSTRFIVLAGDVPALKLRDGAHEALFTAEEADALGKAQHTVFLGLQGRGGDDAPALFAHLIGSASADPTQERGDLAFVDLRNIAAQGLVALDIVGALAQAKSLLSWHDANTFCANCGQPSRLAAGGSRRECDNCGRHHFPRVDPVVIMLVSDGERALLGRQKHFPKGMYTCLAGFVEPGETAEDAVRREILEEAGLEVGRVDYYASQPWPFPSSLMIGCLAQASTREIVVDRIELEDARWFPREEVLQLLEHTHPEGLVCPPRLAIANALMRAWAESDSSER